MQKTYLSHARVGIWMAIKNEEISEDFNVLLPDYICESVPNYLISKQINLNFYKIDRNLRIDWINLKKKINSKSRFLIIVNFFGFPLDLTKSIEFAKENNLILIEDSTHCHGGKYHNIDFGNFGDYAVTSPRKHIPLKYGGILFSKKNIKFKLSRKYKTSSYYKLNYKLSTNFLNQKLSLKKLFRSSINSIPSDYEKLVIPSLLDKFSKNIIDNNDWNKIRELKIINYNFWDSFSSKNNLKKIINHDLGELNPWALPVLLGSRDELLYWLNWAIKNNVIAFSWPTLCKMTDKNSDARFLSNTVLCFSTYTKI